MIKYKLLFVGFNNILEDEIKEEFFNEVGNDNYEFCQLLNIKSNYEIKTYALFKKVYNKDYFKKKELDSCVCNQTRTVEQNYCYVHHKYLIPPPPSRTWN